MHFSIIFKAHIIQIRIINSLFWYFLMQICPLLGLPEGIYFYFELFQPSSTCSQFQKCLKSLQGGSQLFSKMSEIQKSLKFPMGGKGKPNWEFFPIFLFFFMMAPLRGLSKPKQSRKYVVRGGEGVKPIWEFFPNFSVFFMAPLR